MNLGNPVEARQGAIQEQFNKLGEIVGLLAECTISLHDRIEAILRPGKQTEEPQVAPHSSGVPLAMKLEEKNMELHDIMAKINSIIDRVEL